MSEPRRWMDYGTSGVMPPVEVVAAADYDALRARVAEAETYRTFWQRYAMPPKARPSCLVCGRVSEDWPPAIKHMALPSVIVCTPCVTAVRTASNKTAP